MTCRFAAGKNRTENLMRDLRAVFSRLGSSLSTTPAAAAPPWGLPVGVPRGAKPTTTSRAWWSKRSTKGCSRRKSWEQSQVSLQKNAQLSNCQTHDHQRFRPWLENGLTKTIPILHPRFANFKIAFLYCGLRLYQFTVNTLSRNHM